MKAYDVGKTIRMNKIFRSDKALIVPIDDSLISGPENGLRDIRKTIKTVVSSDATAMMMTYGSFVRNFDIIGDFPCILNVTGSTSLSAHTNKVQIRSVENAIKTGFVGIAAHINMSSIYESNMLEAVSKIAQDCVRFSMPLMVIVYPRKEDNTGDYNYKDVSIEEYSTIIRHSTRVAVELGADLIKTHYTGTIESFETVIESAEGVPVLISGQSLRDEALILQSTRDVMKAGAAGVCFGRNIYNRNDSKAFISELSKLIWQ